MNTHNQLRTAVANIQDELQRIIAVADLKRIENDVVPDDFRSKLINEFNAKLRGFKSKVRDLTEENSKLRERIRELQGSNARLTKSEGAIPDLKFMAPPKKRKTDSQAERVQILSSPIKGGNSPVRSRTKKIDLTSSQFNRLPTQYSDSSDLKASLDRAPREISSPVKASFAEEDDRVVADSQDEYEPLDDTENGVPKHYTALQRIEFLRNYYRMKFSDPKFKVDLTQNPITEKAWTFDDFRPNAAWTRPKHLHSHAGAMTKAQEQNYRDFFREAGHGVKIDGPNWQDCESKDGPMWQDYGPKETDIVRSQIMDKYLSPPGFMVGSFPNTQEEEERKEMVRAKAVDRLSRRLTSATQKPPGEFILYEEVLNKYIAQNRYTR